MYANLKPFSLMGLPNKFASSEEDDMHHVATKRDFYDNRLQDKRETLALVSEGDKGGVLASPPRIIVPYRGGGGGGDGDGDQDGWCTTPKAEDRGEVILQKCPPPPPRKPKSVPLKKRKQAQRVLLDLSKEIDSMFPSNILRDFMCGKIKKVRTL